MDSIYDLISYLISEKVSIKSDIESSSLLSYIQSFYLNIDKDDYYKYKPEFSKFPQYILVNEYKFDSDPEIELVDNKIQISVPEDIFIDDYQRFNDLYIYDVEVFMKFSKIFFNNIKIANLHKISKKARVLFLTETNLNFENSIFSEDDIFNKELFIPEILLYDDYFSSIKILALPNIVPEYLINELSENIVHSQLELLSNHFINDKKYIIYSEKNISFESNDIKISIELIKDLEAMIRFIFEDERHYYDKLEIFRNIFSNTWLTFKKVDKYFSKELMDNVKNQYSLFVSDSLDKFIKDKQIITDKYITFLQNISEQTKRNTEEIQRQILTLIGIIISTFFITGMERGIEIILTPLLGLLYLGISYILKEKNGWHEDSNFFENEMVFMNDTYGKIYKFDTTYTDKLSKKYIDPAIKKLKLIETWTHKIYYFLLIIFCIWFLYA